MQAQASCKLTIELPVGKILKPPYESRFWGKNGPGIQRYDFRQLLPPEDIDDAAGRRSSESF